MPLRISLLGGTTLRRSRIVKMYSPAIGRTIWSGRPRVCRGDPCGRPYTREGRPDGSALGHASGGARLAEVLVGDLRQVEHRHLVLLEQRLELGVGVDRAAVLLVLQAVLLDVLPQLLDDLGPGEGLLAHHRRERGRRRQGLHKRRIGLPLRGLLRGLLLGRGLLLRGHQVPPSGVIGTSARGYAAPCETQSKGLPPTCKRENGVFPSGNAPAPGYLPSGITPIVEPSHAHPRARRPHGSRVCPRNPHPRGPGYPHPPPPAARLHP